MYRDIQTSIKRALLHGTQLIKSNEDPSNSTLQGTSYGNISRYYKEMQSVNVFIRIKLMV